MLWLGWKSFSSSFGNVPIIPPCRPDFTDLITPQTNVIFDSTQNINVHLLKLHDSFLADSLLPEMLEDVGLLFVPLASSVGHSGSDLRGP